MVGVPGFKTFVAAPPANSVAAAAGLHEGDRVLAVDGTPTETWDALRGKLVRSVLVRAPAVLTVQDAAGAKHEAVLNLAQVRTDPQYLFDDLGLDMYQPPVPAVVGAVVPGSPAQQAGLRAGDVMLAIDGTAVHSFQQVPKLLAGRDGQVVKLRLQRGAGEIELSVVPAQLHQSGRSYVGIGVQVKPIAYHMVLGDISTKNISGPINTAQVVGLSASIGLWAFLQIIALVSLNLGIVNLLPIPLLDGGQILYGLVEWVKGSPLSERAQAFGQQVGLTFLVLLMGLAFYNDLTRLIG
jgi:regulator of sigma E protease